MKIINSSFTSFINLVSCLFNLDSLILSLNFLSWKNKNRTYDSKNNFSVPNSNLNKQKLFFLTILIFIPFYFIQCSTKKDKQKIASLLYHSLDDTRAFFSYPGRFVDITKKREVIEQILSIISNAKYSLKIYAYSLNNPEIIEALKEARKRGVIIEITGDKDQNYELLQENGFVIRMWKQSGLHHIKVILADDSIFFTGTGNFSRHGLTNDWNGYIQFTVEEKNRTAMLEFLEEQLTNPVLYTNQILFISSPDNGFLSQNLLLQKIEEAKISINYLIFDHFDSVISHALKQASSRGVIVTGVYDAPVDEEGKYLSNQFYGFFSRIYKDGNEDIRETAKFPEGGLLHHKSMIIDGKTLLSGSYNYSLNARNSNREILFMSENPYLVSQFQEEFNRVRDRSYPLPMNRFHTFPEIKILKNYPLNEDTLCLPQNINSPVIELGNGIWKSYLSYPKIENTNCFLITSYANISSGLTNSFRNDFLSLRTLWDSFQIYDKYSNISYIYNSPVSNSMFYSNKNTILKKPRYLSFTNNNIYFEMAEKLDILGKTIHYLIPGKQIRTGVIEKNANESGFYTNINTTSTERSSGGVFIEMENEYYFFCHQDRTKFNRAIMNYLLKQIYFKNYLIQEQELSCITN